MFNDLTNYTCCNGDMCISGRCGERKCPEFCLVMEVCCCFPSAVATNRFMIQDEQRVMNTECDNCLIGFMLCMNQLACIFRIAAMISGSDTLEEAANILDCIADVTYVSVCACMQTQHHEQLKLRDPNARPPAPSPTMAPQQMQMQMRPMPPPRHPQQAYAPQQVYAPQSQVYAPQSQVYGHPAQAPPRY
jgi:hypothetical protein